MFPLDVLHIVELHKGSFGPNYLATFQNAWDVLIDERKEEYFTISSIFSLNDLHAFLRLQRKNSEFALLNYLHGKR